MKWHSNNACCCCRWQHTVPEKRTQLNSAQPVSQSVQSCIDNQPYREMFGGGWQASAAAGGKGKRKRKKLHFTPDILTTAVSEQHMTAGYATWDTFFQNNKANSTCSTCFSVNDKIAYCPPQKGESLRNDFNLNNFLFLNPLDFSQ